ncbi:ABC transporter substrate-binding protein [Algoriphagus namhaensis]
MKNLLLFIPLFFIFLFSQAQTSTPENYQAGLAQLKAKNYSTAIPLFTEFLNEQEYGELARYAAFHLAEAQLGSQQYTSALRTLQMLATKNWKKSEETNYLLALAYFKTNQPLEALKVMETIEAPELRKKAENATFINLKEQSPSFLVNHLKEFKDNAGYRAALRVALDKSTILSATERAAYYELNSVSNSGEKVDDLVLDLVVILPFSESGQGSISPESFVYELYQGIEMGIASLRSQGVKVKVSTFDTKRDLAHLQRVLGDPIIARADVIIGPIYPDEAELVSAFAESQAIPFIHPLSNLADRFEGRAYSYLFRPSVESLSDGIIQSLRSQNWGRAVAIGSGGSSRDVRLAEILTEKLPQAGFSIVKNERVNPGNVREFMQGLGIRSSLDSMSVDADQVILLTDNPNISQAALFLMESVTTSVPVLVMDSWLGFNFANFEMLEFPNFYFIGNNAVNMSTQQMEGFRARFYEQYSEYPSLNAALGRELIFWISSNLSDSKGFDLRRNLDQAAFQSGRLSWGFNFQNSNYNQYVPIFRLEKGELKPLD